MGGFGAADGAADGAALCIAGEYPGVGGGG